MSGLPKKLKGKSMSSSSVVRPEDVAVMPKPGMNIMKRPLGKPVATSSTSSLPPKKPRLDFGSGTSTASTSGTSVVSSVPGGIAGPVRPPLVHTWKECCHSLIIFETFSSQVKESCDAGKFNKVSKYMCTAMKQFMDKHSDANRFSFEYQLITVIVATVKEFGVKLENLSFHQCVMNSLCGMGTLSHDRQSLLAAVATTLASKQTVALNMYYLTAFLHDALGDRHFVDKACCAQLVSLILGPFGTRFPSKETYQGLGVEVPVPDFFYVTGVPNKFLRDEIGGKPGVTQNELEDSVLEVLRKWWDNRSESPPRNLVRTMSLLSGLPEVRLAAAKKIDSWVQNGKLQRHALELMIYLGKNIGSASSSKSDMEALSCLLRMRSLKSKQVATVFNCMLRELIEHDEGNLRTALHLIVANEFGPPQNRFSMNMSVLQTIFSFENARTTQMFAEELSSMVLSREEYSKPARLFTRELIRSVLRSDFLFATFADAYLKLISEEAFRSEHGIQDHVLRSAVEVITTLPLYAISPSVKEAFASRRGGLTDQPNPLVHKFEKDLVAYFEAVLKWLQNAKMLFMSQPEYTGAYYKFLYIEKAEFYTSLDQGPTEVEMQQCMRVIGECPMSEKMLWLLMGDQVCSLPQFDVLEIMGDLFKRGLVYRLPDVSLVSMSGNGVSLADRLFQLCLYRPPAEFSASQSTHTDEPIMYTTIYWKAWYMVVLWTCLGKLSPILKATYDNYPFFRYVTQMMLTKEFRFPLSVHGMSEDSMSAKEAELHEYERKLICDVETVLAQRDRSFMGQITEDTSQLLKMCSYHSPKVTVRRPADNFLDDIEKLSLENGLAAKLCECRSPDLLGDLIEYSGPGRAMPAIQELISECVSAIASLPLKILSHFYLFHLQSDGSGKIDSDKERMIELRLGESMTSHDGAESLEFLLERLSAPAMTVRTVAYQALSKIFKPKVSAMETDELNSTAGLLSRMAASSAFKAAKSRACELIAHATQFEGSQQRMCDYIKFVIERLDTQNMHQLSISLSQLVPSSSCEVANLLLDFLVKYMDESSTLDVAWSDACSVEQKEKYTVVLAGKRIGMTASSVDAVLRLLCRTTMNSAPVPDSEESSREELIGTWFPSSGKRPMVEDNTGTVRDVLSEQLRSTMLCAADQRIVNVALEGMTPSSALLLISSFGLTTFSASQLLKVIDKMEKSEVEEAKALRARSFVVAYRHRGAQGGDKFLQMMKNLQTKTPDVKAESDDVMIVDERSAPVVLNLDVAPAMDRPQAIKCLQEMTTRGGTFELPSTLVRAVLGAETIGLAMLDHIDGHIRFFLDTPAPFQACLLVLDSAAQKFSSVSGRLSSLANRLLKSAPAHNAVQGILRKYASALPKRSSRKKELDTKTMSATALLDMLFKSTNISKTDKAKLMTAFLDRQPDIIPMGTSINVLDEKLLAIFSGRNGMDTLVSQLAQRASLEVRSQTLKRLLDSHNKKLNAGLVCDFVSTLCDKAHITGLSEQSLYVLAQYMADSVADKTDTVAKIKKMVEKMVSVASFDVLLPIMSSLAVHLRSEQKKERRVPIRALMEQIQNEFPCIRWCKQTDEISLVGRRCYLAAADIQTAMLIETIFDSQDQDQVAFALDALNQTLSSTPQVVAREFGVISSQLTQLMTMDARELKTPIRRATVELVLSATTKLLGILNGDELDMAETAIDLLLAFFEKSVIGTKQALGFADSMLKLCHEYLDQHLIKGREFVCEKWGSIEPLCKMHPDLSITSVIREQVKIAAQING